MKIVNIVFKVLKITICVILALLIAFFATFIVKKLTNKGKPVSVLNIGFYEVSSWSMYDYLSVGDLVVVVKQKDESYKEGMVVTYLSEGMRTPVTHKIVKREGNIITTRGINTETNNSDDVPFDVKDILGEVKFVWRGFGKFMNFVKSPLGIVTILLGAFVILGTGYFIDTKFAKKEVSENED